MKLESFIAIRYLKSKHKINFITIISLLSIIGITVGVSALIIVLSVFNGFSKIVTDIFISFDPHIKIISKTAEGVDVSNSILKALQKNQDVHSYTPFVNGKCVAYSNEVIKIVNLIGIGTSTEYELSGLKNSIVFGEYNFDGTDLPSAIIGMELSSRLKLNVGDTITIVSPDNFENLIAQISLPKFNTFIVRGIFHTHNKDIDGVNVYVNLNNAQYLLGYENKIFGYEVRLKELYDVNKVKKEIEPIASQVGMDVQTWFDLHKDLYSVMLIERWTAYVILSLIIAVATFSIFSSLFMTVLEKKRDIGILKAMGVNNKSILKIFLLEGILIGIIGTILGTALGLLICYLQIEYKLYPLNPDIYIIDALPVYIQITDILIISLMAIFLSTLAGYFPARKAVNINPVEAIKWE